ncbi:MAG: DAK2 domain-containing protein [Anaerovibrio sp.]|nr:DAK2 domain-containing protein [Anaerovibrio sp.]
MGQDNEVITGADYKRMIIGAYSEFILEYDRINKVKKSGKFFYCGMPGTDVLRTMGAAVLPLSETINESIGGLARRIADAAVLGARGNAGVILSQILRGLAKGLVGRFSASSQEFGKAFQYGILYAQKAVPEQKDRPIIVASKIMAKGAYHAVKAGLPITDILRAAIRAGEESFSEKVDSGEMIMQVFLNGCLKGIIGEFVSPVLPFSNRLGINRREKLISPVEDLVRPYCITFMVANPKLSVELLERELAEIGNFVVVERRFKNIFIHLHSEHPGKVLERAVGWGHIGEIHINIMAEPHAMAMVQQSFLMPLALMTVASSPELGQRLQEAGATVILDGSDPSGPSVEEIVNAAHSDIANKYIILSDTEHIRLVLHQAWRILGDRVEIVIADGDDEQIQAVRAFFPEDDIASNVTRMKHAILLTSQE